MKKIILGLVAAATVAAPIALSAGSANAATTDVSGVVTVTKGDIQSAMDWNNSEWDTAIKADGGVTTVGNLITASGSMPVDVPGGWLTLNGQIVENYPDDEYFSESWTHPENWCNGYTVVESHWTGGIDTVVTPIRNSQQKVTGYKVSAVTPATDDGYVYYTRHTTGSCYEDARFVYHATSRWPVSVAGSGVSAVKVNGEPVTVTPYVAPAAA